MMEHRDQNGKITRAGAEEVIKAGGSVCFRGAIVTDVRQLPPESAFAAGSAQQTQEALENIQRRREELAREETALLQNMNRYMPSAPPPKSAITTAATQYGPRPIQVTDYGAEPPDVVDGLESMNKITLQELAETEGVPYERNANKQQLIDAIRKHRAAGGTDPNRDNVGT